MKLLGLIGMLGGIPNIAKALGVSPATIRHWMRTHPRGFLKYCPELKVMLDGLGYDNSLWMLVAAVTEAENDMRA